MQEEKKQQTPTSAIKASEYIGDYELALGAKEILDGAEEIDSSHILINVKHGVITLEGTVPDHSQRVTALSLVSDAYPTKLVKNELHLSH